LEDFIASNNLHVINEDNGRTTFQSSRGKSNIDLTITNNQILADIKNWDIPEKESASDHNIIKFSIRLDKHNTQENHYAEQRYRIKEHLLTKFNEKLHSNIAKAFQLEDKERNTDETDEELSNQVRESTDIGHFTFKLEEVIQTTCRETRRHKNPANSKVKGKTVPWWMETLKIMRKRTNALRR